MARMDPSVRWDDGEIASFRTLPSPQRRLGSIRKSGRTRNSILARNAVPTKDRPMTISIRAARPEDIGTIHAFILALADYEKLRHEVQADRDLLATHLFGPRPTAEVLI